MAARAAAARALAKISRLDAVSIVSLRRAVRDPAASRARRLEPRSCSCASPARLHRAAWAAPRAAAGAGWRSLTTANGDAGPGRAEQDPDDTALRRSATAGLCVPRVFGSRRPTGADAVALPGRAILDEALLHVPRCGWTTEALVAGAKAQGLSPSAHGIFSRCCTLRLIPCAPTYIVTGISQANCGGITRGPCGASDAWFVRAGGPSNLWSTSTKSVTRRGWRTSAT